MLPNEARWMATNLARFTGPELGVVVNLGSGSLAFRTKYQPFIERDIVQPLRHRGASVVNVDFKHDDGVDVVGSIYDVGVQEELARLNATTILCQNMLEHVPDPSQLAAISENLIPVGGLLFVSVPYQYPFHADPIDTGFRPTPEELSGLYPRCVMLNGDIVSEQSLGRPPFFGSPVPWVKLGASLVLPYPSRAHLRTAWSRKKAWGKPCSVTCAVFQKSSDHLVDPRALG